MRWRGERQSDNVEDRRGAGFPGGGPVIGGGIGLLVVAFILMLLGVDPTVLLNQLGGGGPVVVEAPSSPQPTAEDDSLAQFMRVVLAETEDVWNEQFRLLGGAYEEPTLVFFSGQAQSACGYASAAVGPFYCPTDRRIYLDFSFFHLLEQRLHSPGDFARAYVLAHEVGHHVQNLMGLTDKMHALQGRVSQEEYNALSVRLELQADFLAGVWAHHTQRSKGLLEPGDVEEAMRAAASIGDDNLQRRSQGYVVPESFTHGTSEQRLRWFMKGYETGDIRQGDTFAAEQL
jgi:predicted metalloprotease